MRATGAGTILGLMLVASQACILNALAADYYVATNGLDGNPGTLVAPFRTIQRASGNTAPGDVVYIRGGTYRETVTPTNSGAAGQPILYTPYNGEDVTISGLDVITNTWTLHSNGIYKTTMDANWDFDQLFVDGEEYLIARWPNNPGRDRMDSTRLATVQAAAGKTIQDSNIPGDFWTGGKLWIVPGVQYVSFDCRIVSYNPATHEITFDFVNYSPGPGDRYYLQNKLEALDIGGEFYLDKTAHVLYVKTLSGDTPAQHLVEAKKRWLTLSLNNVSHLQWDGIHFHGGGVNLYQYAESCVIRNCRVTYPDHLESLDRWEHTSGVYLQGSYNRLEHSEVAYTCGAGVETGAGSVDCEVTWCTLHDLDYSGSVCAGIWIDGTGAVIMHNTIYRVGRDGISGAPKKASIRNNDVSDYGVLCKDLGGFYCVYPSFDSGTIAYNVFHDPNAHAEPCAGIYFDMSGSYYGSGFVAHHNVCYGHKGVGIFINDQSSLVVRDIRVFNNTLYDNGDSLLSSPENYDCGIEIRNNIGTDGFRIDRGESSNNFTNGNPLWVNPAGFDFRLQSGSPCVDAGALVPGITDGYAGAAPDQGAFESGVMPWTAGSGGGATAPAAPTGLTATAISANEIRLAWSDVAGNEDGYRVERRAEGGSYAVLALLAAGATGYADTNAVLGGVCYTYRVFAVRGLFNSRSSNEASATPPVGLAGHWRLDETDGTTAADATVNHNDGTLTNGPVWIAARYGNGTRFDGADDRIDLPSASALDNVQEGNYTLSAWYKPARLPPGSGADNDAAHGILMKQGQSEGLCYGNDGRFRMAHWLAGDARVEAASTNVFSAGQFAHVAGVVDRTGRTVRIYVNGALEGMAALPEGNTAREYGITPWRIGIAAPNAPSESWPAEGVIDDARIYSRALTPAEAQAIAAANQAPAITLMWADMNTVTNAYGTTVHVTATDADGDALTYAWTKSFGSTVLFDAPDKADSRIVFGGEGTFTLRVTVSDGKASVVRDLAVQTTVNGTMPQLQTLIGWGSYWPLDATNGVTAKDNTIREYHGTLTGAALPTWTAGREGNALNFPYYPGIGYVAFPGGCMDSPSFYCVAMWVKPAGDASETYYDCYPLLTRGGRREGLYYGGTLNPDKKFRMRHTLADGIEVEAVAATASEPGAWYHVAGVVNSSDEATGTGTVRIYVNGALSGTATFARNAGGYDFGPTPVHLGNLNGTHQDEGFRGVMDEVLIYNRTPFSAAEVRKLAGIPTDTNAPSVPTNLAVTARAPKSISLAWHASTDDVAVTGYRIYRDGASVGTSATTNYTNSGLTPNSSYSYCVAAYDVEGNQSAQSAPLAATTLPPDTSAPSAPSNLVMTARTLNSISLAWRAATDDVAVTGYRIYRDGFAVGTSATTNYTNAGLWPNTLYSYRVSAYDEAANESALSAALSATTVAPFRWDVTAPTLTVVTPPDPYYTTNGAVCVAGTATDISGVLRLTVNGSDVASVNGYANWAMPAVALALGTNLVTVAAEDQYENATSVLVRVIRTLDPPPTVTLVSPTYGASYTAPTNLMLQASAADNVAVARVEFFKGAQKLGEDATAPYSLVWANASAGVHRLTAQATDSAGQTAWSGPVDIAVYPRDGNQPPTVDLFSPMDEAHFNGPLDIPILVNATDDMAVAKVEFYRGTVKLGESTTAPYGMVWLNVEEGSYRLTARAIDSAGLVSTSAPVEIVVTEPAYTAGRPGGVGSASDLGLWCRADDAGGVLTTNGVGGYAPTVNNGKVSLWRDLSAMEAYDRTWHNRLVSANDAESPRLTNNCANGLPMLYFDGNTRMEGPPVGASNQLLNCAEFTLMVVNRYAPYSGESRYVFQTGQEKGNGPPFTEYPAISMGNRRTILTSQYNFVAYNANNYSYVTGGAGDVTAAHISTMRMGQHTYYRLNSFYNGVLEGEDVAYLDHAPFNARQVHLGWGKNPWNDPKPAGWFQGYIGEVIVFHRVLGDAERLIVENYLAAKFGLTMSAGDKYIGDEPAQGNYDFDVIGIGKEWDNRGDVANTVAFRAGLVLTAGTIVNGEYLLAGHKTATNSLVASNLPAGVDQRWNRVWYMDKTGAPEATMLAFDWRRGGLAGEYDPGFTPRLLYRATEGSAFSVIPVAGGVTLDRATFTVPNALLADGYYTLGLADAAPPTLAVSAPVSPFCTTSAFVNVAGTAWDASGVATVKVNGAAATSTNGFANWSWTVTGLAAGTNVLTVAAVDQRGNAATAEVRVIRVAGSALLAILSPPDLTVTMDSWIVINGLATDADGVMAVTVNGIPAGTSDGFLNWACLVSGLAPGTNALTAEMVDGLGNRTTAQVRVLANALGPPPPAFKALPTVRAGVYHSLALKTDGSLWAWGEDSKGQLGDGSSGVMRKSPVPVTSLTGVFAAAAGNIHSLALRTQIPQGWSWGGNVSGQLGDGTTNNHASPAPFWGVRRAAAIAVGYDHSLALKEDGTVWSWGNNGYGQLGIGSTANQNTPVQVSGLDSVIAIDAGAFHSLAVKSNGTVWAWGENTLGGLGDGTNLHRTLPVQVLGLSNAIAVAGGYQFSAAVRADGTVWAWGANAYGKVGDGTSSNRYAPVQVPGISNAVAISLGDHHALALKADGRVLGWGGNWNGQVGDGTTQNRALPVAVSNLADVVALDGGGGHSLAVKVNGTVWSWGWNHKGQLGDGSQVNRYAPVQVPGLLLVEPMTLAISAPANLAYTTNNFVMVNGTASSDAGVANVTVNGAAASTSDGFTNWSRMVTGLAVGTNVLTAVAVDAAANAATARVSVIYAAGSFDGNGDGIPDAWQMGHFGTDFITNADASRDADPDHDGMLNWQEWQTGTDPRDGVDRLAVTAVDPSSGGAAPTLQWRSVSGHVYVVQWSTNLAAWSSFTPAVTAVAPSASAMDPDAGQVTNRFYRVRQP